MRRLSLIGLAGLCIGVLWSLSCSPDEGGASETPESSVASQSGKNLVQTVEQCATWTEVLERCGTPSAWVNQMCLAQTMEHEARRGFIIEYSDVTGDEISRGMKDGKLRRGFCLLYGADGGDAIAVSFDKDGDKFAVVDDAEKVRLLLSKAEKVATFAEGQKRQDQMINGANVKGLMTVCLIYAGEHDGAFPPDFDAIIKSGDVMEKQLVSPSDSSGGRSYKYIAGHTDESEEHWVVIYESWPGQSGGGFVGYADGSVLYVDSMEEIEKQVEQTKQEMAKVKGS